jgi:hypothetical protein
MNGPRPIRKNPVLITNIYQKMKTNFNILDVIRAKYVQVIKMIPLSNNIGTQLSLPFRLNSYLSMGKRTGLAARVNSTRNFISFVLKLYNSHGASFTIKWLKASSVALQKYLGDDRLRTLRTLDDTLPLPRLNNGVPRYISVSDRVMIRKGDVRFIRFHLGLLNLYRVLEAPGVLKLETITSPFSGNQSYLDLLVERIKSGKFLFFDFLPGFDKISTMSLNPKSFVLSRSASPSNKMSAQGIITDVFLLNRERPDLWQDILDYLYLTKPKVTRFVRMLQDAYEIGLRLDKPVDFIGKISGHHFTGSLMKFKSSITAHGMGSGRGLSQFAVKHEAAGKIRLFALLDSITQSVLAPLHQAMFAILRVIPNDGTFNQEDSIKRSQNKAITANCAFSFDLTAATDRLPVIMTAFLIEGIWKLPGIALLWRSIMTNRDFSFNGKVAEKLKVSEGPYRYAVGQPMGGLSSWPGLALTHHWIVQYAAYQAHLERTQSSGGYSWCENYEILGDDLVIFDALIASKYLEIMAGIGCEINMNKSINSPNKPVFEFAKRTCIGNDIVSGISLNQVRAGWNVGSRVANALSFSQTGLLTSVSLLATVLSRYAVVKLTPKELGLPTLALLGSLFQQGKLTHRMLAHALVNPHYADSDFEGEAVGLPIRASLIAAFDILNDNPFNYPYSHEDLRDEVFKEYRSEFSQVLLAKALKKATILYENSDILLAKGAMQLWNYPTATVALPDDPRNTKVLKVVTLVGPTLEDMPKDIAILAMQIENFFNMLIEQDDAAINPETLHDKVYAENYKFAKHTHLKFDEAIKLLEEVESLEFKYTLKIPEAPGKTVLETTPIIGVMRNMVNFLKVQSIFGALDFKSPVYGELDIKKDI